MLPDSMPAIMLRYRAACERRIFNAGVELRRQL